MQMASISNAIAGIAAGSDSLPQAGMATTETPFAGLFKNAIHSEQSLEDQASTAVEGLMTGQGVDVHQAMIATQKANLAFEMALAVRSKAVAAYQQIMQMQF
jgi:flagellar hook-basal body complex protein FliE